MQLLVQKVDGKTVKHQNFKRLLKSFFIQEFRLKLAFELSNLNY